MADEFKAVQLRAIRLSDGRLRVPGMMRLDQASLLIGREWHGSADTVGADLVRRLGRVPEPGEHVAIDDMHVEVEVVEGDHVMTVIVGRAPTSAKERT